MRFSLGFYCSFIVAFAALWLWLCHSDPIWLHEWDASMFAKNKLVASCDVGELSMIGDSALAVGVQPSAFPDAVNYAQGGMTVVEAYFLTLRLLSCPKKPEAVLLSFSPHDLQHSQNFLTHSVQKYGNPSWEEFEQVRKDARRLGDYYPPERWHDAGLLLMQWAYVQKFPLFYNQELGQMLMEHRDSRDYFDPARIGRGDWHIYRQPDGDKEISPNVGYTHFIPRPMEDLYLHRIIERLGDEHIPVYFLLMPISEASGKLLKPAFRQELHAYLQALARRYPGFHLLTPDIPELPWTMFMDGQHVNRRGSDEFTRIALRLMHDATDGEGTHAVHNITK